MGLRPNRSRDREEAVAGRKTAARALGANEPGLEASVL